MILHAFYNREHAGDVLLCRFANGHTIRYERKDDVVYLYDSNDAIIGLNILNASNYFHDLNNGQIQITPVMVDQINKMIGSEKELVVECDTKDRLIVGKVIAIEAHPDSDHLHVCQVDLKDEVTQIVCGAPNVALNQLVVVATIGTMMPSGLLIVPSVLRKVKSNGMLCSARELNLENAPEKRGILVLDDRYEVGQPFFKQYKGGV